jgi:hypothetical protein
MNYLGHNEFGLNHKPWNDPINYQDRGKIDYWLEQWSLFYKIFITNINLITIVTLSYMKN